MYLNSQILGRDLNCLNWFWTYSRIMPYNVSFDGSDFQSEMYLGMIVFVMHFRLEINSINTDVVRYYSCWSSKSVRTILTVSIQICTTIPSRPPVLFEMILNFIKNTSIQRQFRWNRLLSWNASGHDRFRDAFQIGNQFHQHWRCTELFLLEFKISCNNFDGFNSNVHDFFLLGLTR